MLTFAWLKREGSGVRRSCQHAAQLSPTVVFRLAPQFCFLREPLLSRFTVLLYPFLPLIAAGGMFGELPFTAYFFLIFFLKEIHYEADLFFHTNLEIVLFFL